MGCGGSKLDTEQNTLPARLRPVLHRRLEESLGRRSCNITNGLPDNELLEEVKTSPHELDEEQEEIRPAITNTLNFVSHCTCDCPSTPQKITIDDASSKSCEEDHGDECETNVSLKQERSLDKWQCRDDNKDDNGQVLRKRRASEGSLEQIEEEIITDDYEQAGLLLCPGSPSFRVYCQFSPGREEPVNGHVINESNLDKSQRDSLSRESSCSNEVSIKKIRVKWGKQGMKFKIMRKGRRNIFNSMPSFYNFPCSTHNSNTPILEKSAS